MTPQALRAIGAGWLIFFLIWLPFEDTGILFPAVLALDLGIWLGLRGWPLWIKLGDVAAAALSAAAWLGSLPLLAVGLMMFKGGLHGHGFGDFTASQVQMALFAAPIFVLAGAVLGAVVHLLIKRA
jgi:hypothetical protein